MILFIKFVKKNQRALKEDLSDYTPAYRQALNLIWYRAGV
jgi:hypothetical protein